MAIGSRRRIVAALDRDNELTIPELVDATGLPPRDVADDCRRLADAGLLQEVDNRYRLITDIFERSAREAALTRIGELNDFDTQTFRRYFYRNRLTEMPVEHAARKVVLDLIIEDFSPEETYTEREVNTTLYGWYGDWALLRRLLVDFGYLSRDHGKYKRVVGE